MMSDSFVPAVGAEGLETEGDSIPTNPEHWRREHYIPLRRGDLPKLLADEGRLSPSDRTDLERFCEMLSAVFHYEFLQRLESLKRAYAPFDPDADTIELSPLTEAQRQVRATELFDQCVWLLERANYVHLDRSAIEDAVGAMSDWGVNIDVDFGVFERLEVYSRGDIVGHRTRRRWRNAYRLEEVDVPIFQRLVILFQFKPHKRLDKRVDARTVYIKIFKNIPKMDVDMLLPGTSVRMSRLDQGKIFLPTLSGMGFAVFKIVKTALVVAAFSMNSMMVILGLLGGTLGYGVRGFFGYVNAKQKYQLNLAQSLYYQNLDNNAGVLFRLLDEAEEQECREAVLAYFFLWREGGSGMTEQKLDRRVEAYLRGVTRTEIDFEHDDALAKLVRLGLVERTTDGRFSALAPRAALELLDRTWDNYFQYSSNLAAG